MQGISIRLRNSGAFVFYGYHVILCYSKIKYYYRKYILSKYYF